MIINLQELRPNPFRNIVNYPINRNKVEQLKISIQNTGFWDNLLARNMHGRIEIAYGHHRLVALNEIYPPTHSIDIPIKDISDEMMLKIMANENMNEWGSSMSIIDETIKATIKFLKKKNTTIPSINNIKDFLNWPKGRVEHSVTRINAINDGIIYKDLISELSAKTLHLFIPAVKRLNLNRAQQEKAIKDILSIDSRERSIVLSFIESQTNTYKRTRKSKMTPSQFLESNYPKETKILKDSGDIHFNAICEALFKYAR